MYFCPQNSGPQNFSFLLGRLLPNNTLDQLPSLVKNFNYNTHKIRNSTHIIIFCLKLLNHHRLLISFFSNKEYSHANKYSVEVIVLKNAFLDHFHLRFLFISMALHVLIFIKISNPQLPTQKLLHLICATKSKLILQSIYIVMIIIILFEHKLVHNSYHLH